MIDKDTGKAVANGPVYQRGGYSAVHAPTQPADHLPAWANLGLDAFYRLLNKVARRPITHTAADAPHKVCQQRRALWCMHHFGMKLDAIDLAAFIGDGSERR